MDKDTFPPLLGLLHSEFFETNAKPQLARNFTLPKLKGKAQVFVGVRRSGKTFCLYQEIHRLLENKVPASQILYLNFEDDRLPQLNSKSMGMLLDSFYTLYPDNHDVTTYLFLDEVQNVEGWSKVVRRYLDRKNCEIFISGSSAKLLSTEIATEMRGRSYSLEVFPFSMEESFQFLGIPWSHNSKSPREIDRFLLQAKKYLIRGGFPEVQPLEKDVSREILQGYVNTVVVRDIVDRYRVSGVKLLKYLIHTLISNTGCLFSANKFFHDVKSQGMRIGKNTVYDYLSFVEDAYLCFSVPIYSKSIRKKETNPRKIYCVDPGLATAYTLGIEKNLGRLFETMIYIDLRRRGHKISYFKTKNGNEVDFVSEPPRGKQHLFQSCLEMESEATKDREFRSLKEAEKELGIRGIVVTLENYSHFLSTIE